MKVRQGPKGQADFAAELVGQAGKTDLQARLRQSHQDAGPELRVTIKTITPIYGGSALAGKPDLLMPFRPRAIRNGVAHWWWLLNRHQASSPEALWEEYALTFGARAGATVGRQTGGPSPLQVRVTIPLAADEVKCAYWWTYRYQPERVRDGRVTPGKLAAGEQADLGYALFAARGELSSAPNPQAAQTLATKWAAQGPGQAAGQAMRVPGLVRAAANGGHPVMSESIQQALVAAFTSRDARSGATKFEPPALLIEPGIQRELSLRWVGPMADEAQRLRFARLRKALHLWLCFGGLGGRTSRGLGAFEVVRADFSQGQAWRVEGHEAGDAFTCAELLTDDGGKPLAAAFTVLRMHPDDDVGQAWKAWEKGVREYRALRQARLKDQRGNSYGLSVLPDADAMRILQSDRRHRHHVPRHPATKTIGSPSPIFADLGWGAPVVMKFKNEDEADGDPKQAEIGFDVGERPARFPSPFRLRPVRLGGEGRYSCVAVFLPSRGDLMSKGLRIKVTGGQTHTVPAEQWQGRDAEGTFQALASFTDSAVASAYGCNVADLPAEIRAFHLAVNQAKSLGAPALIQYLVLTKRDVDNRRTAGGWQPVYPPRAKQASAP